MQTVSIIGVGRLGGALALALDAHDGYEIESLISRDKRKAETIRESLTKHPRIFSLDDAEKIKAQIIFICTQDAEIANVVEILAGKLTHQAFVFHTSGALSSEMLNELKNIGSRVGSIHPLVSVSDSRRGAAQLRAAFFCVEGETEAIRVAEKLVGDLGGESFSIETAGKTLYHAAAVIACGHFVALLDAAIEILNKCGLDEEKAKSIFLPLIKSTVENLERQTPARALTGTFARADVETFRRHLEALGANVSDEIMEIYLLLGLRSLPLAKKQGANPANINQIQKELLIAKKKLK